MSKLNEEGIEEHQIKAWLVVLLDMLYTQEPAAQSLLLCKVSIQSSARLPESCTEGQRMHAIQSGTLKILRSPPSQMFSILW